MKEERLIFHGMEIEIDSSCFDKRGRRMYAATADGATIAKSYSESGAIAKARLWAYK